MPASPKVHYEPVPREDDKLERYQLEAAGQLEETASGRAFRTSRAFAIAAYFAALATPILLLILVVQSFFNKTQPARFANLRDPETHTQFLTQETWDWESYSPCGHSIEDARAAGCRWSTMMFAWMPPECFDDELERDFLNAHDWTWYETEDLLPGTEFDREAIIRGDIMWAAFSTYYHSVHCVYLLRKLQRSVMGFALCDNYMLRWKHIEHCERTVEEDYESQKNGSKDWTPPYIGKARYLDCVSPGVDFSETQDPVSSRVPKYDQVSN